ncbi:Dihydroxy-acid dehydratase [subsurface metagenome]
MGKKLEQMDTFTRALSKSHLISCDFSYEDLQKPIIAIANSWNDFNHGHIYQREISRWVKAGVIAAGGTPMEFHTPAPCDGLAVGNPGMRYILPTRELVANVIEATISAHPIFDGLVLISSCDKITPGMLIAAAQLKMPTIHVAGGPSIPEIDFEYKSKIRKAFLEEKISEKELAEQNSLLYSTPGNCPYIGTANTMNSVAEALGLALPGSSLAPTVSARRANFAEDSGKQIVQLVEKGITADKILTREAFENAVRVAAAIGGSSNYVLHIPAIAKRAGIDLSLEDIDRLNQTTPLLTQIAPNGPYSIIELDKAGSIKAVMNEIRSLLNLDVVTVTGHLLRENLENTPEPDRSIIKPFNEPIGKEGGIVILHGNLAPQGAVVKRSAVNPELYTFSGPARVFTSEQDCINAVRERVIREGEVLIVRYEGPRGGPGMSEMHRLSNVLDVMKSRIALITDGRYSGADRGLMIGHVTPEAYCGGPIGIVNDGDIIEINLNKKTLNLIISNEELQRRLDNFTPTPKTTDSELLNRYRKEVGPASKGAVW